jgi:UDP-N-acetylmuramate dehydrogenase
VSEAAKSFYAELSARVKTGEFAGLVADSFPLAPLTTYKLGGSAEVYAEAESEDDLAILSKVWSKYPEVEVTILGRGSNILVSDTGVKGLVIRLGEGFHFIEETPQGVRAGGVVALPLLARWAAERGYTGLEFGVGIPASVGGAVRMNAGGHGSEIREVLESARIFDLESGPRDAAANDLGLAYRRSNLKESEIVVAASFRLSRGDPEVIKTTMADISRWRKDNQPGGKPSAGSVFKNPDGDSAGRLIDLAGCKGLRIGGAEVSRKHANFFVAGEGATASDVAHLMVEVRRRVFESAGVVLEPEVRLVGDFGAAGEELKASLRRDR